MTFVHRETVRFREVDAMGHVNNAVFAAYAEQARIETIEIAGTPARVGTKSLDLEYVVRAGDRVLAEARTA